MDEKLKKNEITNFSSCSYPYFDPEFFILFYILFYYFILFFNNWKNSNALQFLNSSALNRYETRRLEKSFWTKIWYKTPDPPQKTASLPRKFAKECFVGFPVVIINNFDRNSFFGFTWLKYQNSLNMFIIFTAVGCSINRFISLKL